MGEDDRTDEEIQDDLRRSLPTMQASVGAAVTHPEPGKTIHWVDKRKHRDDGPAFIIEAEPPWAKGYTEWWQHGQLHRNDGPAIEHSNGAWWWYRRDQKHRDGREPAAYDGNGGYAWYVNDQLHRLEAPAITYPDGRRSWWVEGRRVSTEAAEAVVATAHELDLPLGVAWSVALPLFQSDRPATEVCTAIRERSNGEPTNS